MKYAVVGESLFDGRNVMGPFYFIVEDGKFVEIGDREDKDLTMFEVLDVKNQLITPGLIDCHVHVCLDAYSFGKVNDSVEMTLVVEKNLRTLLHNGFVYVRDVGAPAKITNTIKKMIEHKVIPGPNMKISGQAICISGGHGWQMSKECDSCDEVRKAVRENMKDGSDLIKLMVTGGINTKGNELAPLEMSSEEIRTAVEEAHKKGRKVAVHTHGRTGIALALQHGVDSIEHGLLMDDELSDIALDKGIFLVPTLSAPYFAVQRGLKEDPNSKSFKKSQEVMGVHNKNTTCAYKKGVKIAMGSDSGTPFNGFDTVLEELVLLNSIGIAEEDVFRIATLQSAELLEIEETHGSIDVGKDASFLVFERNPLIDIKNVHTLCSVYKSGEQYR